MTILVAGATGFIGSKVVQALRARDHEVRALVRRPERASRLTALGAELATGDLTDAATLRAAVAGCSHVLNLVAIIQGRPGEFHRVMTEGNRALLAAAQAEGVERYVLMSALGAGEATKDTVPYFTAKWAEEQDVAASGLEHVVLRPSFVFGPGGGALPTFVRQVRLSPVVTVLGDGRQRSQPIWVEDVAEYVARAVDDPRSANRTFELGGPDTVDWNELYLTIAKVLGKRRTLVHVPLGVARLGALLVERVPGAPLSADQVTMIEGPDNVVSNSDAVDTFQIPLLPLEEQIRRST